MKTKLLKKIRKRFVIFKHRGRYQLKYRGVHIKYYDTKQDALDYVLSYVKEKYSKPIKVWWNGNN